MEKAATKLDGKVTFYYIDIEKFPQVGEMLQVSSVPHVFAVKGGEVVDEFTGVQSDQEIEEFYKRASEWRNKTCGPYLLKFGWLVRPIPIFYKIKTSWFII